MTSDPATTTFPTLEEMQHWTWVVGKAQQMMIEHSLKLSGQSDSGGAAQPMAFPSFGDGQSKSRIKCRSYRFGGTHGHGASGCCACTCTRPATERRSSGCGSS